MLAATLLSLGVVVLAEIGDRSRLITMTYALRYRWRVVRTGVAIAAFKVHGVSATVGHFRGAALPTLTLAEHDWTGVRFGSARGMILADGLANVARTLLHLRLSTKPLNALASVLYLLFGLWMLFDGALGRRSVPIAATATVALAAVTVAASQTLRRPRMEASIAGRSSDIS